MQDSLFKRQEFQDDDNSGFNQAGDPLSVARTEGPGSNLKVIRGRTC